MILAEPPRTAYDLSFQMLGFPVRIHPLFWLIGFVLGFRGESDGIAILTWMMVLLVSILLHELGHAVLMRRFGRPAHIVLYAMGGLAIEGEDSPHSSWSSYGSSSFGSSGFGRRSRTPAEQIVISFAGPAAGFILAAFVVVGVFASGGSVSVFMTEFYIPWWHIELGGLMEGNGNLLRLVDYLLQVNILWGLMNLLPIFPLDGGQIAQQLMIVGDPLSGTIRSLWLSVIVATAVAIVGALVFKNLFLGLMFASLAVSNYFTLQQIGGQGGGRPW